MEINLDNYVEPKNSIKVADLTDSVHRFSYASKLDVFL